MWLALLGRIDSLFNQEITVSLQSRNRRLYYKMCVYLSLCKKKDELFHCHSHLYGRTLTIIIPVIVYEWLHCMELYFLYGPGG